MFSIDFPWFSIDFPWFSFDFPWFFRGFPRFSIDFPLIFIGFPWFSINFPWIFLGFPWFPLFFFGFPLFSGLGRISLNPRLQRLRLRIQARLPDYNLRIRSGLPSTTQTIMQNQLLHKFLGALWVLSTIATGDIQPMDAPAAAVTKSEVAEEEAKWSFLLLLHGSQMRTW